MEPLAVGLRVILTFAVLAFVLTLVVQRRPVYSVLSLWGLCVALVGVLISLDAFLAAGIMSVLHATTVIVALLVTNSMLGSRKESRRARSLPALIPALVWAGAVVAILVRHAVDIDDALLHAPRGDLGSPSVQRVVEVLASDLALPLLAVILIALLALIAGRVLTASDTEEEM